MTDSNMPPLARSVAWACGWLFMLCALFLVNAFAALVGLRVFSFTLPLVIVLSLVGLYWLGKIDGRPIRKRALVLMGASFLAAVILCGYAVSVVWEHSNWGRGFYTEAIVQLAAGWNPIYDDAASVSEVVLRSGKAFWYVDASVYAFLGHYEMAKVHTLLFAVPAFLLARHCFVWLSDGRRRVATLAALLSLVSPVAISQVLSLYADAALAYCIQSFLLLGYLILNEGYLHSDLLGVLAALWIFILHAQSGGLTAAFVLAASFIIIVAVLYKKRAVRWLAIRAALVIFTGFVILGFNPYIQNLVDTGSLICKVDVTSAYTPVILEGKTWFGRFLYSLIASPDVGSLNLNILLQQFTALFHSAYARADVPLRGFGFLGGLLIILGVVLTLVAIIAPRRRTVDDNAIYIDNEGEDEEEEEQPDYIGRRTAFLWFLLPLLAIALFSPTIWWARSVAFLWFIVPLAVIALSTRRDDGRSGTAKLLLMAAFLNCALVAVSALPAAKVQSDTYQAHWQRMNTDTDLPTDEDAQLHNEIVSQFPAWNDLKRHGESAQEERAIWTKLEELVK